MSDPRKIGFPLQKDDAGYPPAENEWILAEGRVDGSWVVDNVPWYSRDVSLGDVVTAELDSDGLLWFREVVERSGHSTIRVLVLHGEQETQAIRQQLSELGCGSEQWSRERLFLAVDVPGDVAIHAITEFLDDQETGGVLCWETGHVAADHQTSWRR